jgi:hypothetical protein
MTRERLGDHLDSAGAILVPVGRDLVPLQILVDLEEMFDLVQERQGETAEVTDVRPLGITERDAQDLLGISTTTVNTSVGVLTSGV